MLISCKCLNFIATSNNGSNGSSTSSGSGGNNSAKAMGNNAAVALSTTADAAPIPPPLQRQSLPPATATDDCTLAASSNSNGMERFVINALIDAFLQKFPRTFVYYSQCMDFFKQSVGPIPELNINAISQRDLIYSLTLDVPRLTSSAQQLQQHQHQQGDKPQTWQMSICINCNSVLCAKRLTAAGAGSLPGISPVQFLINSSLLTSNEELVRRRSDKSFSDTFGLLIMDHPQLEKGQAKPALMLTNSFGNAASLEPKQLRLRQVQQHLQERVKLEIAETEERIQRYTEQQFALLRNFREKSEQECKLLLRLIQQVPEQQPAGEGLDRAPPALEISVGGISYTARRRNTISSRRDINVAATTVATPITPTTPNAPPHVNSLMLGATNINNMNVNVSAMEMGNTPVVGAGVTPMVATAATAAAASVNRKMSNFDTPPATPEATPMSVGNSPTFRQQQQQQQQLQQQHPLGRLISSQSFQQQFPTPTAEVADECLFELEGVDTVSNNPRGFAAIPPVLSLHLMQQQQQQLSQYQRGFGLNQPSQMHDNNNMSDLEESDGAEEAEDALDMDSSMPIPTASGGRRAAHANSASMAQMMNFAKSLPIEIANSPLAERAAYMGESEEDDVDNTVDIAASIKALAKSVHGDSVFGDLPRPRLRSQI